MLIRFMLVLVPAWAMSQAAVGPVVANMGVVASQQSGASIVQRGSIWTWNRTDNGDSFEMKVRGEVEFNDDYTEVKRVSNGGSVEIRETRGGLRRRIEIEAGPGGG